MLKHEISPKPGKKLLRDALGVPLERINQMAIWVGKAQVKNKTTADIMADILPNLKNIEEVLLFAYTLGVGDAMPQVRDMKELHSQN